MENKVKLMCSYGGKIHHRPHDRKLSYVGGDTKILTVDRTINFNNLLSKLTVLCESNSEIRLKYKLPGQDLDALVSVFDDDDVDNMFFEYDLLRRISAAPVRLRLFVFFPSVAAVTTPVTARSVNPDFLFGFDKEYSLNVTSAVHNSEITDALTSHSGGLVDVTPVVVEMPVARGSYVAPVVYQTIQTSSGFFQAGGQRMGNREQGVVYGYIPGGNREQPVVYGYVPVMPSGGQEGGNVVPVSGSPLSYDGTQVSMAMMNATSNHESKFGTGTQHDT
ncbi:putative PB1 domain-containing protein [Helianthus annuus]|nr:putative PB1 domain-containing protein [Helianthus annuus]KAJ0753953.1 putative PB1 domain-containing protein [Helianthus annuus]